MKYLREISFAVSQYLAERSDYLNELGAYPSNAPDAYSSIESGDNSTKSNDRRPEIPPFRTTAHVGEDFVHLLTGLRRIDESILYFDMREGDRLGHAVALGVDVKRWCKTVGRVAVSREERAFDLAWEWKLCSEYGIKMSIERLLLLKTEIDRLSGIIFGIALSPSQVCRFVSVLHNPDSLRDLGYPDGSTRIYEFSFDVPQQSDPTQPSNSQLTDDDQRALHSEDMLLLQCAFRYLRQNSLFERSQIVEWVDPLKEEKAIRRLQEFLRGRVGQLGLTIEVNPSSNLLIANLADFKRHPLWRLAPPSGHEGKTPVAIAIGSDDPLPFATNLMREYQLVQDSLELNGMSYTDAENWVDRVRQNGLKSRFTLPQINPRFLLQPATIDILKDIEPPL